MRWRVLGVALCHLSPPPSLAFHARACLSRGRAATSAGHAATRLDAVATAVHQPDVPYSTSVEGDGQSTWAENFELDSQGKVMLKGLLFSEMEQLIERIGEKQGRAAVLAGWLYHERRLVRDIAETAGGGGDDGKLVEESKTGTIPAKSRVGRKTREAVGAVATADGGLELEDVQLAADGTRKLVSALTSGEGAGKKVETVIIPMLRGPQREPRYTVCVSSQVGCAMNCQFCYTGRLGLMANLQAAQIVEQVLVAKRFLESSGDPAPVTGVVFMGMGEPFDNYERVMRAVSILTDSRAGVRLKASSVTVSTVGLVPEIERFCSDASNGAALAISLHAVTDGVRDKLIPVNRRYPLSQLSETLRRHFPRTPSPKPDDSVAGTPPLPTSAAAVAETEAKGLQRAGSSEPAGGANPPLEPEEDQDMRPSRPTLRARGTSRPTYSSSSRGSGGVGGSGSGSAQSPPASRRRRNPRILAVEYTLLGGVNDSPEDAKRLADWLVGVACVVNLIRFNPHDGTPFSSSSPEAVEAFRRALTARGQLCTFRDSRGDDGMAACGQLGGEAMAGKPGDRSRKPVPVAWEPPPVAGEPPRSPQSKGASLETSA